MRLRPDRRQPLWRRYRVAQVTVLCDVSIPALEPFGCADRVRAVPGMSGPPAAAPGPRGAVLYDGPAWIGNRNRRVRAWRRGTEYRVHVEEAGAFLLDGSGRWAVRAGGGRLPPPLLLAEVVLGPVLALALAMRGIWLLHASAVRTPRGAALFAGRSGAGKSTLARELDATGMEAIADDIVPVRIRRGRAEVLPRFPQLKRTASAPSHRRLPLALFAELVPCAAGPLDARPMPVAQAALAFVRHTAAARLFGPELLRRHLAHGAALAGAAPAFRLRAPHCRGVAAEVARWLIRAVESGPTTPEAGVPRRGKRGLASTAAAG